MTKMVKPSLKAIDLHAVFTKPRPKVLVPYQPICLMPQKTPGSKFVETANKVLAHIGGSKLNNNTIDVATTQPRDLSSLRLLPDYSPLTYHPQLMKTETLVLDLDKYLNMDLSMLNSSKLPYLPSSYIKSPNYIVAGPDMPLVSNKQELKGVLAPFMLNGFLQSIPFQISNKYFSIKFIPADNIVAAVRKSKPALVVVPQHGNMFNRFTKETITLKNIKHGFYPTKFATLRSKLRSFYKDLYWEYLSGQHGAIRDGLLMIRYYRIPTLEDSEEIEKLFQKSIEQVHRMKIQKQRYFNERILKQACQQHGLPFDKIFGAYL